MTLLSKGGLSMQLRVDFGFLCALCIVLVLVPVTAGASTSVSVYPPTTLVDPGDTFTVFIWSDDDSVRFNGYETVIDFDSTALAFLDAAEESVMTATCSNRFWRVYPGPDSIYIGHGLLCPDTTVTGPGALSSLTFEVLTEGRTVISADFFWFTRAGIYIKDVIWHDGVILSGSPAGVGIKDRPGQSVIDIRPNPGESFDIHLGLAGSRDRNHPISPRIYDISGRMVKDLLGGTAGTAELCVHWDGTDELGRAVPSGIYLLVLSADCSEKAHKLVLVR
jgi:hypothetical protein